MIRIYFPHGAGPSGLQKVFPKGFQVTWLVSEGPYESLMFAA